LISKLQEHFIPDSAIAGNKFANKVLQKDILNKLKYKVDLTN
jgi:hypothetical protein